MTELYIDGVAVVLPSDFSAEIKMENSFLTKNGEYTYDIRLPLNNPTNADLYQHLHRVNSLTDIREKRTAVLIADNRVLINGTEVINDWTEDSVSIQLVSGNSELNYLIGGDTKITDLDLGTVEYHNAMDSQRVSFFTRSIETQYPDMDYVAAPVFVRSTGEVLNEWEWHQSASGSLSLRLKDGSAKVAQPYLCAIIRRLLQALGYTLLTNQLEDSVYSQLVLVHGNDTTEYAKMIPGWTVKEFFENLENLLNVVLVVNNKRKEISVIFANRFYVGAPEAHLSAIEDEYEVENDDDPQPTLGTSNVRYELPDNDYYKYACLSDSIMARCELMNFVSLYAAGVYMNENKPPRIIAVDTTSSRQYIYKKLYSLEEGTFNLKQVNQFQKIDRGTTNEVSIKMIPCAQTYQELTFHLPNGTNTRSEWMSMIESAPTAETEAGSIEEMIDSGVGESSASAESLPLAFWFGKKAILGTGEHLYPTMLSDSAAEWPLGGEYAVGSDVNSLRLSILDRELYTGTFNVDTSKKYTFHTTDPNLPDIHSVFIIRNKRFVAREMIFQINQGQKVKRWKIVCHPIDMDDTQAYGRWILSDGKWRDGGVWLDDGRWLDG